MLLFCFLHVCRSLGHSFYINVKMYWISITLVSPIFYIELHQMHIKSWTFLTCIYLEAKKKCFRCRSAKSYLYIQRWYRETQCVGRRSFYGYWPLLTSLGHTSTSRSRTMYLWMVWSFIYILKIFEKTSTYSEIFSVSDRPQTLEDSKKSITIL